MIHYVYQTTNTINGMIYIGVKTNANHYDDGYFGSGKHLLRAINKYGINSFTKTVIDVLPTPEAAFAREAEIVHEDFIKRADTYNIALGGNGGNLGDIVNKKKSKSLKGRKLSDETKKKISDSQKGNTSRKGAKWSEESKKRFSAACKGRPAPNKGVPHSEEAKANMRKPHKSTGPKLRLSCIHCKKETTVNAFWRHEACEGINA